ncbi:hypothetical protein HDU96_004797 [Phlyctochytrium bullatum]|nr:hypothetical protein HDU96_004797 [Phlyctochytrium bullatum]
MPVGTNPTTPDRGSSRGEPSAPPSVVSSVANLFRGSATNLSGLNSTSHGSLSSLSVHRWSRSNGPPQPQIVTNVLGGSPHSPSRPLSSRRSQSTLSRQASRQSLHQPPNPSARLPSSVSQQCLPGPDGRVDYGPLIHVAVKLLDGLADPALSWKTADVYDRVRVPVGVAMASTTPATASSGEEAVHTDSGTSAVRAFRRLKSAFGKAGGGAGTGGAGEQTYAWRGRYPHVRAHRLLEGSKTSPVFTACTVLDTAEYLSTASTENVAAIISNMAARSAWDSMFESFDVIERLDSRTCLVRATMKGPGSYSTRRDFILVCRSFSTDSGWRLIATSIPPSDDAPPSMKPLPNHLRGHIELLAWTVTPERDTEPSGGDADSPWGSRKMRVTCTLQLCNGKSLGGGASDDLSPSGGPTAPVATHARLKPLTDRELAAVEDRLAASVSACSSYFADVGFLPYVSERAERVRIHSEDHDHAADVFELRWRLDPRPEGRTMRRRRRRGDRGSSSTEEDSEGWASEVSAARDAAEMVSRRQRVRRGKEPGGIADVLGASSAFRTPPRRATPGIAVSPPSSPEGSDDDDDDEPDWPDEWVGETLLEVRLDRQRWVSGGAVRIEYYFVRDAGADPASGRIAIDHPALVECHADGRGAWVVRCREGKGFAAINEMLVLRVHRVPAGSVDPLFAAGQRLAAGEFAVNAGGVPRPVTGEATVAATEGTVRRAGYEAVTERVRRNRVAWQSHRVQPGGHLAGAYTAAPAHAGLSSRASEASGRPGSESGADPEAEDEVPEPVWAAGRWGRRGSGGAASLRSVHSVASSTTGEGGGRTSMDSKRSSWSSLLEGAASLFAGAGAGTSGAGSGASTPGGGAGGQTPWGSVSFQQRQAASESAATAVATTNNRVSRELPRPVSAVPETEKLKLEPEEFAPAPMLPFHPHRQAEAVAAAYHRFNQLLRDKDGFGLIGVMSGGKGEISHRTLPDCSAGVYRITMLVEMAVPKGGAGPGEDPVAAAKVKGMAAAFDLFGIVSSIGDREMWDNRVKSAAWKAQLSPVTNLVYLKMHSGHTSRTVRTVHDRDLCLATTALIGSSCYQYIETSIEGDPSLPAEDLNYIRAKCVIAGYHIEPVIPADGHDGWTMQVRVTSLVAIEVNDWMQPKLSAVVAPENLLRIPEHHQLVGAPPTILAADGIRIEEVGHDRVRSSLRIRYRVLPPPSSHGRHFFRAGASDAGGTSSTPSPLRSNSDDGSEAAGGLQFRSDLNHSPTSAASALARRSLPGNGFSGLVAAAAAVALPIPRLEIRVDLDRWSSGDVAMAVVTPSGAEHPDAVVSCVRDLAVGKFSFVLSITHPNAYKGSRGGIPQEDVIVIVEKGASRSGVVLNGDPVMAMKMRDNAAKTAAGKRLDGSGSGGIVAPPPPLLGEPRSGLFGSAPEYDYYDSSDSDDDYPLSSDSDEKEPEPEVTQSEAAPPKGLDEDHKVQSEAAGSVRSSPDRRLSTVSSSSSTAVVDSRPTSSMSAANPAGTALSDEAVRMQTAPTVSRPSSRASGFFGSIFGGFLGSAPAAGAPGDAAGSAKEQPLETESTPRPNSVIPAAAVSDKIGVDSAVAIAARTDRPPANLSPSKALAAKLDAITKSPLADAHGDVTPTPAAFGADRKNPSAPLSSLNPAVPIPPQRPPSSIAADNASRRSSTSSLSAREAYDAAQTIADGALARLGQLWTDGILYGPAAPGGTPPFLPFPAVAATQAAVPAGSASVSTAAAFAGAAVSKLLLPAANPVASAAGPSGTAAAASGVPPTLAGYTSYGNGGFGAMWTPLSTSKKGLSVSKKLMNFGNTPGSFPVFRGTMIMEGVSPEEVFAALVAGPACRKQWDEAFESSEVLEDFGGGLRVEHQVLKGGLFVSRRDMVVVTMDRQRPTRTTSPGSMVGPTLMHVAASISEAAMSSAARERLRQITGASGEPSPPGAVAASQTASAKASTAYKQSNAGGQRNIRAHLSIAGWILEPIDPYGHERLQIPSTRATFFSQVDLGGGMPEFYYDALVQHHPKVPWTLNAFLKTTSIPVLNWPVIPYLPSEEPADPRFETPIIGRKPLHLHHFPDMARGEAMKLNDDTDLRGEHIKHQTVYKPTTRSFAIRLEVDFSVAPLKRSAAAMPIADPTLTPESGNFSRSAPNGRAATQLRILDFTVDVARFVGARVGYDIAATADRAGLQLRCEVKEIAPDRRGVAAADRQAANGSGASGRSGAGQPGPMVGGFSSVMSMAFGGSGTASSSGAGAGYGDAVAKGEVPRHQVIVYAMESEPNALDGRIVFDVVLSRMEVGEKLADGVMGNGDSNASYVEPVVRFNGKRVRILGWKIAQRIRSPVRKSSSTITSSVNALDFRKQNFPPVNPIMTEMRSKQSTVIERTTPSSIFAELDSPTSSPVSRQTDDPHKDLLFPPNNVGFRRTFSSSAPGAMSSPLMDATLRGTPSSDFSASTSPARLLGAHQHSRKVTNDALPSAVAGDMETKAMVKSLSSGQRRQETRYRRLTLFFMVAIGFVLGIATPYLLELDVVKSWTHPPAGFVSMTGI